MPDIEKLVAELRRLAQGSVKWFAMNKDETAYFIDFNTEWEAVGWLDRQKCESHWIEREGVHLVKQRVYSELETLANKAADELEAQYADAKRWHAQVRAEYESNYLPCASHRGISPLTLEQYKAEADANVDSLMQHLEPNT